MYPILGYCAGTCSGYFMHNYYTGWSRLHSLFCLPFLFTSYKAMAADLIWLNSCGCALSVHLFYSLTYYEPLSIIATRTFAKYKIHSTFVRHLIADSCIHCTPICLSLFLYTTTKISYKNKEYIWLVPALSHAIVYPCLTSWNPAITYKVDRTYPTWKYAVGWMGTFFSYSIVHQFNKL
jgi:hypothetical protein